SSASASRSPRATESTGVAPDEDKDEGGRMKDEVKAVRLSLHPSSFRLHPFLVALRRRVLASARFFGQPRARKSSLFAPARTARGSFRLREAFGSTPCALTFLDTHVHARWRRLSSSASPSSMPPPSPRSSRPTPLTAK